MSYKYAECWSLTSVTIPNSVTTIGERAFKSCSGLTSMTIPNSVTDIGSYAFEYCSKLTSVTIPNSVTDIGSYAFRDCSKLTSVTIPNSVTTIRRYVFYECSALTSVTIPSSVTSIEDFAFYKCSKLISVHISDLAAWCKIDFKDNPLYYAHHLFLNGVEVKELVIPNSVTSIRDYSFWKCSGLTSVTIPNNVTSIGICAFNGCSGLTSATIPNNVTTIRRYAFSNCSDLKTLTIGNGIKNIYEQAFANCENLADVYCHAEIVPSTSTDAFDGSYIEYAKLHVPEGSVDLYKATEPWSRFGTLKPFSGEGGEEGEQEEPKKCEKPTISYHHGELSFASATEGVDFVSDITDSDIKMHHESKVNLSVTYTVTVYATKTGYENSETATATLCWIDVDPRTEGIENGVANVKAMPVLIQAEDGVLRITGAPEGTTINVYEIGGQLVGFAKASSDITIIPTTLPQGSIAIVKIGDKAVKVLMK